MAELVVTGGPRTRLLAGRSPDRVRFHARRQT